MCDKPSLIAGPVEAISALGSALGRAGWKVAPVAGVLFVAGAMVSFAIAHAVILAVYAVVFVVVMGGVLWAMRRRVLAQGRARAATRGMVTRGPVVTQRPARTVRAVTAGPRAIEAPKVIPARVLLPREGETMRP